MKTVRLILAGVLVMQLTVLANCKKDQSVPDCIQKKIEAMKNEPVRNPPGSVWRYSYKGRTVYYIPAQCCDQYSELYDDQCNLLCHPDGGFTGKGDGTCTDFATAATGKTEVWTDPRK
ncbi:MAG: hypothetical protein U0T73_08875 [Chitinophagales bacterium]